MAHLTLSVKEKEKDGRPFLRRFINKLPNLTGKLGLSVFVFKKEIFVGIAFADVEIEKVIRRRKLKIADTKGKVKIYRFD